MWAREAEAMNVIDWSHNVVVESKGERWGNALKNLALLKEVFHCRKHNSINASGYDFSIQKCIFIYLNTYFSKMFFSWMYGLYCALKVTLHSLKVMCKTQIYHTLFAFLEHEKLDAVLWKTEALDRLMVWANRLCVFILNWSILFSFLPTLLISGSSFICRHVQVIALGLLLIIFEAWDKVFDFGGSQLYILNIKVILVW